MVGSDFRIVCLLCAALCMSPQIGVGQAIPPMGDKPAEKAADGASGGAASSKFEAAIKGAKKVEGLWTVYFKEQQVLVDLKSSKLGEEYLMLTSIAKGVSQGPVLGGMTWGDDVVWSFRKVGERVHVLRKNVRFKAKQNSPEASAVKLAYSDSVLYALPIVTDTPGGHLVDMTRIFMSDDEQIGRAIGAPLFANDRSTVAKVQAYRRNVEIQINAVYSSMSANKIRTPFRIRVERRLPFITALANCRSRGIGPARRMTAWVTF